MTVFTSEEGNDIVYGDAGNDYLLGEEGNDYLNGGEGDDTLSGGDGRDALNGGVGNDFMDGGEGNDSMHGGAGSDEMFGDQGNDTLRGGSGDDKLWGGRGDDSLEGGEGNDTLTGGIGNDSFLFDRDSGHDIITDFDPEADKLMFVGLNSADGLNIDHVQRRHGHHLRQHHRDPERGPTDARATGRAGGDRIGRPLRLPGPFVVPPVCPDIFCLETRIGRLRQRHVQRQHVYLLRGDQGRAARRGVDRRAGLEAGGFRGVETPHKANARRSPNSVFFVRKKSLHPLVF